jgi:ATP-binding cassette subfamily F protein 3
VLVSHDRHFLDRVVNKVWRVEEGHVEEYEGNFSEYLWQAEHGTRSTTSKAPAVTAAPTPPPTVAPPSAEPTSGPKSKEQKRREAQEREKLRKQKIAASGSRAAGLNSYQLKKEYAKTESEVETMETKKAELEAQLADPATFSDPAKGKALMAEFERLQTNLTEKNKDWEDLASEMSARDLD